MKRRVLWVTPLVVLVVGAGVIWNEYGTLEPCGMLKKEVVRTAVQEMNQSDDYDPDDPWARLGQTLGMSMGSKIIDAETARLSQFECAQATWKVRTEGIKGIVQARKVRTEEARKAAEEAGQAAEEAMRAAEEELEQE